MKRRFKYVRHKRVAALILSYNTESDSLNTNEEVTAFSRILKEDYGFEVVRGLLNSHDERLSVHNQMVKALIDFVYAHDGPDHLLIVYYAGHGYSNKNKMHLAGNLTPNEPNGPEVARRQAEFTSAVASLETTSSDVLLILDCCHAGAICNRGSSRCRKGFQFFGACATGQTTRGPGKESFTSALIWALESLKEKDYFHTPELHFKVQEYPHLPKWQQTVIQDLSSFEPNVEPICIAKASFHGDVPEMPIAYTENQIPAPITFGYLDLRFVFHQEITDEELKDTAVSLRRVINGQKSMISLSAADVNYLDTSSRKERVERYANIWLETARSPRRIQTLPSQAFPMVEGQGIQVAAPSLAPTKPSICLVSDDGEGNLLVHKTKTDGTYAYHLTMLCLSLKRDIWDLLSRFRKRKIPSAPAKSRGITGNIYFDGDDHTNNGQIGDRLPDSNIPQEIRTATSRNSPLVILLSIVLVIVVLVYLGGANGIIDGANEPRH
ncbi:MAG: Phosphatidylinositol-4-phosphate 5-kinase [Bogoriella megaspora]|nr:MAG: Phosphatidylinositol-4-phosphate 5-kinase [Bogoriella megaspora]